MRLASILERLRSRHPRTMAIGDAECRYILDYLKNPEVDRWIPCTVGFDNIYIDPRGNLYSGCMSLKPVGRIVDTPLADLTASRRMRRRLKAMIARNCPGCTCDYSQRAQYRRRMRPMS